MKTRPGEGWRGGEATKRPRRLLTARAAHGSELLRQMGLQFFSSRCKLEINNLLEGSAWCTFFFFQRISKELLDKYSVISWTRAFRGRPLRLPLPSF